MRSRLIVLIGSVLLTACGSDKNGSTQVGQSNNSSSSFLSSSSSSETSSNSSTSTPSSSSNSEASSSSQANVVSIDYDKLISTPQTEKALTLTNEAAFINQIKNGIRLQLMNGYTSERWGDISFSPAPPRPPIPETTNSNDNFSQTNVHVAGIDEADYAKYDGKHWFVSRFPEYSANNEHTLPGLQVVKTDVNTPSAEIIGEISFEKQWRGAGQMYLVQQDNNTTHVAAIRNILGDTGNILPSSPLVSDTYWFWPGPQNGQIRVQLIDVEIPEEPTTDWDVKVDGSLINSKKIGNTLYLITRFDPWLNGLAHEYQDVSLRDYNEELLASATTNDLLPSFQIGENRQLLTTQCYLQDDVQDFYGLNRLIFVTAIDLVDKKLISSQCLNSGVEGWHMSTKALYLTGTVYDEDLDEYKSVIHKFSLSPSGPEYAATGNVPGYFWGGGDVEFRLNEYQGDLRVVATSRAQEIVHKLFVLEESAGELKIISQLPNTTNPEPIGKPGEQIYSVRFNGDSAYIVTFLRTDPFYAIDLSNRLNPKISGQVEMPGFATYIHPIDDNYIFTVGRDAAESGVSRGVKVELIDISESTPKVINTFLLSYNRSTNSEALYDLRALSFLRVSEDQLRIAMPIEKHSATCMPLCNYFWSHNGLQLFEINGLSENNARLTNAGEIISERSSAAQTHPLYGYGASRSVLHDNAIFFSYNNDFWVADWNAPSQAYGPISADPIVCTEEYRYGLTVTVAIDGDNTQKACGATVIATDGEYQETLVILETGSDHCVFSGAGERAGNYSIETSLTGFETAIEQVLVTRDICHVFPKSLEVLLKPVN